MAVLTDLPLVSIIIPTYKQYNVLEETIKSAISQDYENIEVIISDDRSPDQTFLLGEKYAERDNRIKYFRNNRNYGRVGNYHKALYDYANGKYVLNLDGDDLLTDNTFIRQGVELLEKYPDSIFLTACKQLKTENNVIPLLHRIKSKNCKISGVEFVLNINRIYRFSHLTTLYRRKQALEINFYRTNIISSDKESLLRLALSGNVILYNKIVGQWNLTGGNESSNQTFIDALENLSWIDAVHNDLILHTSNFAASLWRTRMRLDYSIPILLAIKNQKRLRFLFQYLTRLVKSKMLFLSILGSLKLIIIKLNGWIKKFRGYKAKRIHD